MRGWNDYEFRCQVQVQWYLNVVQGFFAFLWNFSFKNLWHKREELDEVANVCFMCLFCFVCLFFLLSMSGGARWDRKLGLNFWSFQKVSLGPWWRKNTSVLYKILKLQFMSHLNKCYVDRMMFDSMLCGCIIWTNVMWMLCG